MRLPITLCCAVLAVAAQAQNWALLNPAYKYNYSNDGTDTISNQIFVTHIDTLGVDSFRYELNRIGVVCDTCLALPDDCTPTFDGLSVLSDQGQFFNTRYLISTDSFCILEPIGLSIHVFANIGETWDAGSGLDATISSLESMEILGEVDSTKTITLSNGLEIVISRHHGLYMTPIDLHPEAGSLTLIGVEGLDVGAQFPTLDDIFNYQVGDILQYHLESSGANGDGTYHYCSGTTKYSVTLRDETGEHPTYLMRRVQREHCTGLAWGPPTMDISTIDSIVFDPRPCASDLVVRAMEDLWPGAIGQGGTTCDQQYPWNACLEVGLNSSQNQFIRSIRYGEQRILRNCMSDSSAYALAYWDAFFDSFEYQEGIGLLSYETYFFEAGRSMVLEGWSINSIEVGHIDADDVILSEGSDLEMSNSIFLQPNPANEVLRVGSVVSTRTEYRITNQLGRCVRIGWMILPEQNAIATADLAPGYYLLHLSMDDRSEMLPFIIAR